LRKFALDVSCVKWDPYELANGFVAVNSSVLIPLPEAKDFIIQAEKKEIAEHSKTLTQSEYIQFYARCIDLLKKKYPREYVAPAPMYYYQIPTGISSVHFEWSFHGRPRSSFGVELHFEKGNKESNLSLLSACVKLKDQLEKALNETMIVQNDWGKTWSRLYFEKQQGKITDDLRDWAVEKMLLLIQLLQPELDKINKS
jgi:hypothetical protein